ncbi:MAG: EcsC family protein, partial [Methanosarcinaceae archaeon]|nr:EcsC family protein [Methanosarcinaceae archaeon]
MLIKGTANIEIRMFPCGHRSGIIPIFQVTVRMYINGWDPKMNYTPYERRVFREIDEWKNIESTQSVIATSFLGRPLRALIDKMPITMKETIARAVNGYMEMLKDLSYWTYSEKRILKRAKRLDIHVERISELASCDIEKLDIIACGSFASNKLFAALQGAGCGLGGIGLIAADIPALFGIGFRTVQQIGSSYGFDMRDPAMTPVVMSIYHAGSGISVAAKSSMMADLHIAAAGLARNTAHG